MQQTHHFWRQNSCLLVWLKCKQNTLSPVKQLCLSEQKGFRYKINFSYVLMLFQNKSHPIYYLSSAVKYQSCQSLKLLEYHIWKPYNSVRIWLGLLKSFLPISRFNSMRLLKPSHILPPPPQPDPISIEFCRKHFQARWGNPWMINTTRLSLHSSVCMNPLEAQHSPKITI